MASSAFLSYLFGSISLPALAAPQLALAPLTRLIERLGVGVKDKSPIAFNGEPLQVVLARLNARRNLPAAGKRALKEGPRAKAKAAARQTAAEASQEQKAYEKAFWRAKQWGWRRVEKELRSRHLCLSIANIALLAAEVGISIAVAGEALSRVAA